MRPDDNTEGRKKKKRKGVASAWRAGLARWKMAMGSFRLSATMETAAVRKRREV